jgi:hypothetical protein
MNHILSTYLDEIFFDRGQGQFHRRICDISSRVPHLQKSFTKIKSFALKGNKKGLPFDDDRPFTGHSSADILSSLHKHAHTKDVMKFVIKINFVA